MQVLDILLQVARLVHLYRLWMIAQGMLSINGEIRVVPVDKRVIKTDFQAFGAKCFHKRAQGILAERGVSTFIIRQGTVPQAETFVMLGGNNHVLHTGLTRSPRPDRWII